CIRRFGEVWYQVASLIIGHDDADELRRQVVGFGDDPDARFRSVRAGDHSGDVVGTDGNHLRRERAAGEAHGEETCGRHTHERNRSLISGTRVSSGVSHTPWLKISTSIGPA